MFFCSVEQISEVHFLSGFLFFADNDSAQRAAQSENCQRRPEGRGAEIAGSGSSSSAAARFIAAGAGGIISAAVISGSISGILILIAGRILAAASRIAVILPVIRCVCAGLLRAVITVQGTDGQGTAGYSVLEAVYRALSAYRPGGVGDSEAFVVGGSVQSGRRKNVCLLYTSRCV